MSGATSPRSLVTKAGVLIHLDYSESYENKQQHEIQSVSFGHTRFSIFTVCCNLRDTKSKMICESVTISSELPDLSRAAAIRRVLTVIDHLRGKPQHVLLKNNSVLWSDGCFAQFQSQFGTDSSLNISWFYNERHYNKGSMCGIGGTLKNSVYRNIMFSKSVIDTPKPFAEYSDRAVKGITSLYLPAPAENVLIEPDDA